MFPIASWSLTTQLQTEVFPEAEAGGPQVATYPPRHRVKVKDAPGGADLELATARKATCGEREDQTGARGLVYRETGVWVLQDHSFPMLLCIDLSVLLLRFLNPLHHCSRQQPPISLDSQAKRAFSTARHFIYFANAPIHIRALAPSSTI